MIGYELLPTPINWCDDFFLGRDVEPTDWFADGKPVIYEELEKELKNICWWLKINWSRNTGPGTNNFTRTTPPPWTQSTKMTLIGEKTVWKISGTIKPKTVQFVKKKYISRKIGEAFHPKCTVSIQWSVLDVLLCFHFCLLSKNNKQRNINDLIPTCQCTRIFSSRNYATIMIVLLSVRIVTGGQWPCLAICVIKHRFLFLFVSVFCHKSRFWY